jgi:hypothetical protein
MYTDLHTSTLKVEAEYTKETPATSTRCNYPRRELRQLLILYFCDKRFHFVHVLQTSLKSVVFLVYSASCRSRCTIAYCLGLSSSVTWSFYLFPFFLLYSLVWQINACADPMTIFPISPSSSYYSSSCKFT